VPWDRQTTAKKSPARGRCPASVAENLDRADRLPIYAREGVMHAWLVNPLSRTLEAYRLEGSRWTLLDTFAGNNKVRALPFDTVEIDLTLLWPEA
jgi:hypothetical protein